MMNIADVSSINDAMRMRDIRFVFPEGEAKKA